MSEIVPRVEWSQRWPEPPQFRHVLSSSSEVPLPQQEGHSTLRYPCSAAARLSQIGGRCLTSRRCISVTKVLLRFDQYRRYSYVCH
jgi:hypothetical protein